MKEILATGKRKPSCLWLPPAKTLFIMKWTVALMFIACMHVSARGLSQKVTLSREQASLSEILWEIGQQTGYEFFYKNVLIEKAGKVSIHVNNAPLDDVLVRCFKGQPFTYTIIDKIIVVKEKEDTAAVTKLLAPPPVELRGRVVDEAGNPLSGVSVSLAGSGRGTSTGASGGFSLTVADTKGAVLQFSSVGYETRSVTVGTQTFFQVTLKQAVSSLDEIAVVGFGTQKKVNLTGAVATVGSEVFENRPVTNVSAALQGAMPGLTVTVPSGQPGATGSSLNIRGVSTLNSGNAPLVLIDGVAGGDLNMLNPDDIESVSVLKDASSAAIYGARAANGVILITTRKGKAGDRMAVNYNGYVGVQKPTALPELVNGREYMELQNEARVNAGLGRLYLDDAFEKYDAGSDPNDYSNTDWIGEIYKKQAFQQSHSISINGGNGKTGYYLSYGYLNQDGLIVGDSYKFTRNNVRMRMTTELFDRLKVDGNISYVVFDRDDNAASGTAGVFRLAQRISPLLPVKWYNQVGSGWQESDHYSYGSVSNPVDVARNSGYNNFIRKTPSGNVSATLDIIKGLSLTGQYAFNNSVDRTKEFAAAMYKYLPDGTGDPGNASLRNSISVGEGDNLTQTLYTYLNYERTIKDHYFKAMAGYSQEWGFISSLYGSRKNILMDGVEELSLGTEDVTNSGTEYHWALRSYFGRLNYSYKDRYLLEANIRRDGTSRFAPGNRWGTFPSFSAGWKLSEEPFMEFMKPVVSLFKLRGSYGELGNQNVGTDNNYYPYLTSISRVENSYPIGATENVGFAQTSLGNTDLIWEEIVMTDLGIDLQLLNNRLSFTGDWFVKNNRNALLKPVYPSIIGFTSTSALPLVNMGKVRSKGWEISANWQDRAGDWRYSVGVNLSDVTNTVISLGKSAASLGTSLIREGDPLNAYFGYVTDGLAQPDDFGSYDAGTQRYSDPLFPTMSAYTAITQPGDIIYRDISGPDGKPDGIIDNNDRAIIGNQYPRYMYALRGQLGWKSFDLSFLVQGVGKVNGYLYDEAIHAFINDYSVPQKIHLDRWTPNNTDASYPRLYYAQSHNREFSDYWVQDASYLRVKNIQVGYELPARLAQKAGMSRLRVYVSADNLFTSSNYFYAYDPEVRSTYGDAYPQVKTVVAGLSVTFK